MAKQYRIGTAFTSIDESSGIIYNAGATDVELVSDTNATEGQGILLRSGTAQSFNGTILARSKDLDDDAVLNVVDFSPAASGGSSGGSSKGGSSVKTYASGTAYTKNDLVAYGSKLYLVVKDYTADTVETDLIAGNIVQVNAGGGVQTYTAGKSYKANDLLSSGNSLYLVLKDFTASTAESDVTAGNIVLINSTSVVTSDTDTFMTTDEVDALFA